jgi:hypothetical protein
MHFPSDAGIAARVEEHIVPAAHDSEEDQPMDPDDARDYAELYNHDFLSRLLYIISYMTSSNYL